MLFYIAGIATAILFIALLQSAPTGILFAVLAKPIIDVTWNYRVGGMSLIAVVGVLVPVFVLMRGKQFSRVPLFNIWMIYVTYNLFTFSFLAFESNPLKFVESSFRILNGFVGYYMIQTYFSDKEAFRKLLLFLILAGLLPMLMGLYQAVTGVVWQERMAVGLVRHVGMYHDAVVFRYYAFQTLTAIILYWGYFLHQGGDLGKKALLLALAGVCGLVLFNIHSKAAYVIVALWSVIWFFSRGQIRSMILILCALVAINLVYDDKIWTETEQVFSKEVHYFAAEGDTESAQKRTLAGRWYVWESAIEDYWNRSFFEQIVGHGRVEGVHNDFLKNLLSGGVIGLLIYVLLLLAVGTKIVNNYLQERSFLNVMALMIFAMWLVDTIGLVPSQYPGYQWYVWGFIGLSFKGLGHNRGMQVRWKLKIKNCGLTTIKVIKPKINTF